MNKTVSLFLLGWMLLAAASVSQANTVCGNVIPPTAPPCPPGGPCPCPTSAGVNSFDVRSGNVWRQITDLTVDGSVGELPLRFWRVSTSRFEVRPEPFGPGASWLHSYYWDIRYEGSTNNDDVIEIDYPDGTRHQFQKITTNDVYLTSLSYVQERIEPPGGGTNEYALTTLEGP